MAATAAAPHPSPPSALHQPQALESAKAADFKYDGWIRSSLEIAVYKQVNFEVNLLSIAFMFVLGFSLITFAR